MVALPWTPALVAQPRTLQVASVIRGLLRIRLTFHAFPADIASSRSPSAAAQMGVGLGRPSLVNVVNRMYFALAKSANVGVTAPSLPVANRPDRPRFPTAPDATDRECSVASRPTCCGHSPPADVRSYSAMPTGWTPPCAPGSPSPERSARQVVHTSSRPLPWWWRHNRTVNQRSPPSRTPPCSSVPTQRTCCTKSISAAINQSTTIGRRLIDGRTFKVDPYDRV